MKKERGATLITVLVIGVVSLVFLAGIYYLLTRGIQVSGSVPVYLTLRDAAASGAHYAASLIQKTDKDILPEMIYECAPPINLKFKLKDTGATYTNTVTICLIGYAIPPGFSSTPVIGPGPPGLLGNVYFIDSIAVGPNNTYSKIEAVYTP